jgi:tRNA/tmRNA/rRNA uracil-C5-methylase (TrmA/RlmC/RlmD family)
MMNVKIDVNQLDRDQLLLDHRFGVIGIGLYFDNSKDSPSQLFFVAWNYRNKAQFQLRQIDGQVEAGLYQADSHQLVPIITLVVAGCWTKQLSIGTN